MFLWFLLQTFTNGKEMKEEWRKEGEVKILTLRKTIDTEEWFEVNVDKFSATVAPLWKIEGSYGVLVIICSLYGGIFEVVIPILQRKGSVSWIISDLFFQLGFVFVSCEKTNILSTRFHVSLNVHFYYEPGYIFQENSFIFYPIAFQHCRNNILFIKMYYKIVRLETLQSPPKNENKVILAGKILILHPGGSKMEYSWTFVTRSVLDNAFGLTVWRATKQ